MRWGAIVMRQLRVIIWVLVALGFCVFFVIAANSGAVQWFADILWTIPAPTEQWAAIIGHLAWPVTIGWIVVRFRHSLRRLIEVLIVRFKRDDIGIANVLTVTRNSKVVPLDPSGEDGTSDAAITESLLEFISDKGNVPRVNEWLNENGRSALNVREFITQTEYADLRQRAYLALIKGGEHG